MSFSPKESGGFDLITLAKKILSEVDLIRALPSHVSDGLGIYEESRVNAFLRLIGLPMFVNIDGKDQILNTVFDKLDYGNLKENIDMVEVNGLENNENLREELANREAKYMEEEGKIYGGDPEKAQDIQKSLKNMIPLRPDVVGKEKDRDVYKKLFPLIPKYMVINPLDRNVVRAFSGDSDYEIYNERILKKSFLETVIRLRFSLNQTNNKQDNKKNVESLLASSKRKISQKEQTILTNILGAAQCSNVLSYMIISQLLQSLDSLSIKYLELQQRQKNLAYLGGNFSVILTKNNSASTFSKRISTKGDFDENSVLGQDLTKLKTELYGQDTLLSFFGKSKTGGADAYLTSVFIDLIQEKANLLRKEIAEKEKYYQRICNDADILRAEIDFYTGEFNGLSAFDAASVIMGLFLITDDEFFALLDQKTRDLVFEQPELLGLKDKWKKVGDIKESIAAVNQLQKQVSLIYDYVWASIDRYNDKTKRAQVNATRSSKNKSVEKKINYDDKKEEDN